MAWGGVGSAKTKGEEEESLFEKGKRKKRHRSPPSVTKFVSNQNKIEHVSLSEQPGQGTER